MLPGSPPNTFGNHRSGGLTGRYSASPMSAIRQPPLSGGPFTCSWGAPMGQDGPSRTAALPSRLQWHLRWDLSHQGPQEVGKEPGVGCFVRTQAGHGSPRLPGTTQSAATPTCTAQDPRGERNSVLSLRPDIHNLPAFAETLAQEAGAAQGGAREHSISNCKIQVLVSPWPLNNVFRTSVGSPVTVRQGRCCPVPVSLPLLPVPAGHSVGAMGWASGKKLSGFHPRFLRVKTATETWHSTSKTK